MYRATRDDTHRPRKDFFSVNFFFQSNSILLPRSKYPPARRPTNQPRYAPVTMVTGHFCHSRSLFGFGEHQLLWKMFESFFFFFKKKKHFPSPAGMVVGVSL